MKIKASIFLIACMLVCLVPSVGMLIHPTTQTTENKKMADMPALITEKGLNADFFNQFETYYTQHMALRNEFLSADARIMNTLFAESNISGVIAGRDGWLYYSSTLEDYQGKNRMTESQIQALAWNIGVIQAYVEQKGADFLFLIPPNKNTLYGEYMPYYKEPAAPAAEHNAIRLGEKLKEQDAAYLDLYGLFCAQNEVLYQKRDSHWDEKGAMLVYETTLNLLGKDHRTYDEPVPVSSLEGDLNRMLYSFYGKAEEVPSYHVPDAYTMTPENATVESGWITTTHAEGQGSLLMFRDSFANTLIPLYANVYAESYYSKGVPNMLEFYLERYQPDTVILEKVERNIAEYLNTPPILSAPAAQEPMEYTLIFPKETMEVRLAPVKENSAYLAISGNVPASLQSTDREYIIVCNGQALQPYQTADGGFRFYQKTENLAGFGEVPAEGKTVNAADLDLKVYVRSNGTWYRIRPM